MAIRKKFLPVIVVLFTLPFLFASCIGGNVQSEQNTQQNSSTIEPGSSGNISEDTPLPSAKVTSIVNGKTRYDTDGNIIHAHGGQVQTLTYSDRNGEEVTKFWWIGENKEGMTNYADKTNGGVNAYSSDDLMNWTFEGTVLQTPKKESDMDDDYYSALYATAEEKEFVFNLTRQDGAILERPKLLYNETTKKYVLWFHSDRYNIETPEQNYRFSQATVAVADHPWGPFRIENSYRMYCDYDNYLTDDGEGTVRDMTAYKDDDGTAYLFYSSDWNTTMYIGKLDPSYTAPAVAPENAVYGRDYITVRIDNNSREAPAVAKIKGKYYMLTSGCDAWTPSTTLSYTATSILGEWTSEGDAFLDDTTATSFHSQSTCLFYTGKQWVYMGDRWNNNGGEDLDTQTSTYVWLPLSVENGKVEISYSDFWVPAIDFNEYIESFSEIEIDAESAKKLYRLGDKFSREGIIVTGKTSKGEMCKLTNEEYGVIVPDLSRAGVHTVTVYYGATSKEYGIYVADDTSSPASGYALDRDRLNVLFNVGDKITAESEYIYQYDQTGVTRITDCKVTVDTTTVGKSLLTYTMENGEEIQLDIAVLPKTNVTHNELTFESRTHKACTLKLIVTERETDEETGNVETQGYYLFQSESTVDLYEFSYSYTHENWRSEFKTEGLQETICSNGLSDSGGLFVVVQGKQFFATPVAWHRVILDW